MRRGNDGDRATRPESVPVAISQVAIGPDEERLVLEVLRSGHLAQGPMVRRLEELFEECCGVDHAVAVNSGTTALVAALEAIGIGPGDEVITSPLTFVATINAILERGATVRFADIESDTFTIDPASVAALVNERTRAVIPVHLYGQPADMPRLVALAESADVALVEDAAQAVGATVGDRAVGSFGLGCFSLYATKNVTTGEGGMVTTDDAEVAERLRLLRNQGMRERYVYELVGHNWRMTDLHAAVGIPQMLRLGDLNAARSQNAAHLTAALAGIEGLITPTTAPGRTHVFHQFTVRVVEDAPITRDELMDALHTAGIGSGVYYPRLAHEYECFRSNPAVVRDMTPVASEIVDQVLSIPVHPGLDDASLQRVADGVSAAFER